MFKRFNILVHTFALTAASALWVSAQVCSNPPITRKDYCNSQFAQIEINDLNLDNTYGWYTATNDNIPDYGNDGSGRKFSSPSIQTAPGTFYYQKQVAMFAGPAFPASVSGGAAVTFDNAVPYKMNFVNDQDFRLNAVKVVVKLSSATKTYGFNIRYNDGATTTFGPWLEAKAIDLLDLGSGYYQVEIPLGITITAGTGRSIEFVSDDVATHDPVEAMYWFGTTAYTGGNYADNIIRVADSDVPVGGTPRSPLIFDWDITLLCARQAVTTQLAAVCCTPVSDPFTITTPNINPTNFPITLTASGTATTPANLNYYWYDASNVLIGSGVDKKTISVNQAGQYTLRIVNKAGDEGEFACYGKRSITIGIKSIYAPEDFEICLGEPVTLRGEGAEGDYNWYSADTKANGYIVTKNVQQTDLFILEPGKYTYTVEGSVKLGNIATDGKFEFFKDSDNFNASQPGRTFETAYGIAKGLTGTYITGPGEYRVDDEIVAYSSNSYHCTNPAYWQKTDPITNDLVSRGKIFVADAVNPTSSTAPAYTAAFANANPLWRLSNQPVLPNTTYTFTMDISNWNSGGDPPEIMLLVNGVSISNLTISPAGGSLATGPDGATYYKYPAADFCTWRTITGTWNSGANTTATIAVAEVSNILMGHEFAMDDITFYTGRGIQTDDVVLTVKDCNELQARADGTACIGDAFPLSIVKNTGFLLDWTNAAGTVVANTETANAYPVMNEVYTARAKFPLFNFIKNGSFEKSNKIDFITDMTIPTGSSIEQGTYWIGNGNSTLIHSSMKTGQKDHTLGTTAGNMMLMRFNQNQAIISKTIAVKAGEEYGFSAWFKHMHAGGANSRDYPFELVVGGTVVSTFTLTSGQDWTKFNYTWKATATANVAVVLRSPLSHWEAGLAIDDITLAQLGREATDDVNVSVSNCFELEARADVTVCAGDAVTLNTVKNDGYVTSWEDPSGAVLSTSSTTVVYPTKTGTYLVKAKFPVNNLTVNGNFETGTIDFITAFTKPTGSQTNTSEYIIGKGNETVLHTSSFSLTQKDHTTGTGFMMLARVGNQTKSLMTKTIAVTAGQDYAFSAWFKNMHPGIYGGNIANSKDHTIALYIGGTLAYTYTLGINANWNNMLYKWTAATTGNVSIEIRVTSTHDESALAFDDLKISQLGFEDTDDVLVTVNVCKTLTLSDACVNMIRQVYRTTDGVFMGWYNPAGTLISSADTLKLPGITVGQTVTAKIGVPVAAINPNGNMEQGNTIGYNMVGTAQPSSQNQTYANNEYFYVTNANSITGGEAGFVSLTDADGSGKYLLYHPNSGVDKSLVRTSALSVTAGTTYNLEFSIAYLKDAAYLNAISQLYPIRLFVGGVQVASFTMGKNNTWQKFKYSWIASASANNLVVELKVDVFNDYNTTSKLAYGIDALNLKPVTEILKKDITVNPCTPPCVKPTSVSLSTSTPAPVAGKPKTITVCTDAGSLATLKGTITTSGTPLTGYNHTLYKSGTTPVYTAGTTVTSLSLSSADNGVWILRAEDGTAGNINCYIEDTINFIVKPLPTFSISQPATQCGGTVDLSAAVKTLNPAAPTSALSYYKDTTLAALGSSVVSTSGTYYVKAIANGCSTKYKYGTINVTINTIPTFTVTQPSAQCAGTLDLSASVSALLPAAPTSVLSYYSDTTSAALGSGVVNTSGIYYIKATANGCSSKYIKGKVTVAINPIPTFSITQPATQCGGTVDLSATVKTLSPAAPTSVLAYYKDTTLAALSSSVVNTSGTYYVKATANGCSTKYKYGTINVTISVVPTFTLTQPAAQCAGTLNLANSASSLSPAAPTSVLTYYSDTTLAALGSSTVGTSGTYYIRSTANGCSSKFITGKVIVTINPLPTPVITGNATSCEDSVVTFSIQGADPLSGFVWTYTGASEQTANAKKSQVTVKFLPNITNAVLSVIETDKNGCSNTTPGTKAITVDQKPPLANVGTNFDVCAAVGTFQLSGNDPAPKGKGTWTKEGGSTGGTITNNSLYNTAVTGLSGGQKLVATWKIESQNNYCKTSQATVTVTATSIADPDVTLNPAVTQVCSGTSVTLTATPKSPGGTSNYTFYKALDNSILQAKSTNPVYTFTALQNIDSVYVVLETNSQCVSAPAKNTVKSSSVRLQVDALPTQPNIDNATPTDICSAGLTLSQLTTITNGAGKWELASGPGSIDAATGLVSGLTKGQSTKLYYTVESTPNKKCKALRDSVTIKRSGDLSTADAGTDQKVCLGTAVTLNGSSFDAAGNGESVEWLDVNDAQLATTQQLSRPTLAAGTHVFKYRIKNSACTGVPDVVNIVVDDKPTPANPGSNDNMCGNDYPLKGNPISVGKGKWTADDITVTFKDGNDSTGNAVAENMPKGKTVTFTWQINNGTCIGTPATVKITRFGDLTTPNAGADTTICLGGSVNLVAKSSALASNSESQEWLDPAKASLGSNRITSAGPFNTAGSFKYYYKIENTLCGSKLDSMLVNVVTPPLAEITGPINVKAGGPDPNPNSDQKTSKDNDVTLIATAPLSGYTGRWDYISGEGNIVGTATNPSVDLKGMVTKDLSTEVSWTVKDAAGVCPAAIAKIIIVRKDLPDVQCPANQVICKSAMSIYELTGNIPVGANLESGVWKSLTAGAAVSATNVNKASITQFNIGVNEFEYTITSGVLPAPNNVNSCKVTITVDDVTEIPAISTATGATLVSAKEYKLIECTDKVSSLPGIGPVYSNALWKKDILSGGQGTIANPALANSEFNTLKNIAQNSVLYWWQKNGVCPADSVKLTVERPDSVTAPVISLKDGSGNITLLGTVAENICATSSYTLIAGNKKAGETYTWNVQTGSSIGLPVDKTTQNQLLTNSTILTKGDETTIRLTINPPAGVPCPAAKADVILKLHTVPGGYSIAGVSPVCEDNQSDFSLQSITSTLPVVTYNWGTGAAPDGSSFISQNDAQLKATYKFEAKNNLAPFTQGTIRVSVSNSCGKGAEVDKIVVINLRPRNFTLDFGASPTNTICASNAGPVAYTANVNPALPAGTDYNWYWDNQLIASSGSSLNLTSDKYVSKSGQYLLQVKLHNSCGEAIANDNAWSQPLIVTIQESQPLAVSITPDMPKICEPLNVTTPQTFTASPNGITNPLSTNAVYTFTLKDESGTVLNSSANALNTYSAGGLKDKYTVSVVLSDPNGCFDSPRVSAPAVATIDGYNRPDSSLSVANVNICEGETAYLSFQPSKGNTTYMWYLNDTLPVSNSNILTFTSPIQNGNYKIKINNAVCPSSTSANTPVHVYEKPQAFFLPDPLYIEYREGLTVPMPVVITKPGNDPLIYSMYEPSTNLKDPTDPYTLILPKKEETETYYFLTLKTGIPGMECSNTFFTKVITTLPLKIPDAFTPNGDGLNDLWVIQGINKYPNTKVKIYNRWGNSMYLDNDGYKVSWDGSHNGVPLPTGTYYYIVELLGSQDNTDRTQTGALTIIR